MEGELVFYPQGGPGFSSTSPDSRRQMGTENGTHLQLVLDFVHRALHCLSLFWPPAAVGLSAYKQRRISGGVGLHAGEKRMVCIVLNCQ